MDLDEFYEEKQTTDIQVIENQLIIAKQMQNKLIELETQKKAIEDAEKDMKKQLEEVMRANGITRYESNDKKILISLGETTPDKEEEVEYIDEDTFIQENQKLHNEYVMARQKYKKTKTEFVKGRKGILRITIREGKDEIDKS